MSKKKQLATHKRDKQPTGATSRLNKREIQRITRLVFDANPGQVLSYKQICYAIGKTTMGQKRAIYQTLSEMAVGGELQELEPGRFERQRALLRPPRYRP